MCTRLFYGKIGTVYFNVHVNFTDATQNEFIWQHLMQTPGGKFDENMSRIF
jgi:hypothetical protein